MIRTNLNVNEQFSLNHQLRRELEIPDQDMTSPYSARTFHIQSWIYQNYATLFANGPTISFDKK